MGYNLSHLLYKTKKKELRECFLATLIRGAALALIGIFVPAYLITLGFSLFTVLIFIAIEFLAIALLSPVAARLMKRYGLKHAILSAPFLTIAYFSALYALAIFPLPVLLAGIAFLGALSMIIFWVPMNSHFARHSTPDNIGEESGFFHAAGKVTRVFGPLIGAFVIVYFGFPILFAIGCTLLLLCVVPLFMTKDYFLPLSPEWEHFTSKKNMKYALTFFMQGLYMITAGVLFPFYVYIQSKSFEATGITASLIGLGMVLSAVLIGRVSDKIGRHLVMKISALVLAFVWLLALFSSGLQIYILSILMGVSFMALDISIFAIFCEQLKPKTCEGYIIHREIWLSLGRATVPLLMAITLVFFTFGFQLAFILAAIASIFFIIHRF